MTMMTTRVALFFGFFFVGAGIIRVGAGKCNWAQKYKESAEDGTVNFIHADSAGGDSNIEKISLIEVFSGNYWGYKVVTKICVTYKLKNKIEGEMEKLEKQLCSGRGGTSEGIVVFGEGQYLAKVHIRRGAYVEHVKFFRSGPDADTFGPWGGQLSEPYNAELRHWYGVIHSFIGNANQVVFRLRCTYDINRIYSARLLEPTYTEEEAPQVAEQNFPGSIQAVEALDNLKGTSEQTQKFTFSEKVTTSETTSVTKGHQFDVAVSTSGSAGFDIKVASASITTTYSVGASFSSSQTESTTKAFEKDVMREYTIVAPPGMKVTATLHMEVAEYSYKWTAPVECQYTGAMDWQTDPNGFEGTMAGSQPFPNATVVFTEEGVETGTGCNFASSAFAWLEQSFSSAEQFLRGSSARSPAGDSD